MTIKMHFSRAGDPTAHLCRLVIRYGDRKHVTELTTLLLHAGRDLEADALIVETDMLDMLRARSLTA